VELFSPHRQGTKGKMKSAREVSRMSTNLKEKDNTLRGMFELIREDYRANRRDWTMPGFRALAVHRFGVWTRGLHPRLFRMPFSLIYKVLYRYVRNHYSIELPLGAKIGRRVRIGHQGGIVIHWLSQIGDDCTIIQNVTLGAATVETVDHGPVLGKRVMVGCGAAVIGGVIIGDDVRIGPNAVVTMNVPAGCTVAAPAPRIVQLERSMGAPVLTNGTDESPPQIKPESRFAHAASLTRTDSVTDSSVVAAIYQAIDWINGELPSDRQLIKALETRLVGSQSVLDSMQLVNLIVAIEREVEDSFGVAVTLADERALSMKASPFRSIQSLADYIGSLVNRRH
jgi:serine O-acetyltransferase